MGLCTKYWCGLLLFSAVHTILANNGCPDGLTTDLDLIYNYDGNCYFFSGVALNFTAANTSCTNDGGFLAEITKNETQNSIAEQADKIADITGRSSYWLGIERESESSVLTARGEEATFTNYDSAATLGTGESGCTKMDLTADSKWITEGCDTSYWYTGHICQFTGSGVNINCGQLEPLPGMIITFLIAIILLK